MIRRIRACICMMVLALLWHYECLKVYNFACALWFGVRMMKLSESVFPYLGNGYVTQPTMNLLFELSSWSFIYLASLTIQGRTKQKHILICYFNA